MAERELGTLARFLPPGRDSLRDTERRAGSGGRPPLWGEREPEEGRGARGARPFYPRARQALPAHWSLKLLFPVACLQESESKWSLKNFSKNNYRLTQISGNWVNSHRQQPSQGS